MHYRKIICMLACMLTVFMFGCEKKPENKLPAGLKYDVPGIPSIESFSGVEYEDYEWVFPPVLSVVYKHDGKEEIISPDDPRVIRLLNSLGYSNVNYLSVMLQGYIEEAEIKTYLAMDVPMLEISFDLKEDREEKVIGTTKIVICSDSYLKFLDMSRYSWADGQLAEWYWPYQSLTQDLRDQEILTYEDLNCGNLWGKDIWIDLLEYAGFSK